MGGRASKHYTGRLYNVVIASVTILILILATVQTKSLLVIAQDENDITYIQTELLLKGNTKLDSTLNRIVSIDKSPGPTLPMTQSMQPVTEDTVRVIVECHPDMLNEVTVVAGSLGDLEGSYRDLIQMVIPVSELAVVAELPDVKFIRMPMQPLPTVISEGVAVINAEDWQLASYNGTGVKVGILDVGFSGYTTRQAEGELPPSISTWWAPSIGNAGTEVHGTACAEIVYDIAPDATYYFANFATEVEYGNAVEWLVSQNVDVISCSVGWPTGGPGDGTGSICQVIDIAQAADILWVQSIGNQSQRHWQGDWSNPDADPFHNFSRPDEGNTITVSNGDLIVVALKWDDTWYYSSNDYDLLLYDNTGTLVWGSAIIQDGDDDPWEALSYTATYTGTYEIAIATLGNPAPVNFHLYSYYHDLQYQTASSSLIVPADSFGALAVGAVNYGTPDTFESFSSRGPTNDGRIKPDLVAPDGVSTVTYGTSGFLGTSASAPHTAGAAALVKERFPTYANTQIQSFLEGRAVDLGESGKDNLYGSGRLHLGDSVNNYTLTMAVSGSGNVTPAVGTHTYAEGTLVSVNATAASGWQFTKWTGYVADPILATTNVTMDSDKTIIANFNLLVSQEGWSKTFGGIGDDEAFSIRQTSDGGYIIAGGTTSYGYGGDMWLIKTDNNGNKLWDECSGGSNYEQGYSVCQLNDGNYIIVGITKTNIDSYGPGLYVALFHSNGSPGGSAVYGGSGYEIGYDVCEATDEAGKYIVVGVRIQSGNYDAFLRKLPSSEGWTKTFGGSGSDIIRSVRQTSDGGYIIAGYTDSYGAGSDDFWLFKTDASGNVQWSKTFGGAAADQAFSVAQTADGGYIISGQTWNNTAGGSDFWLVKTTVSGNMEWNKTFGGSGMDGSYSVCQTTDGGYFLTGFTESFATSGGDVWVIKTDDSGNEQWNRTFGGVQREEGLSACQASDGAYIIAGYTSSFGAGGKDVWLFKYVEGSKTLTMSVNGSGTTTPSAGSLSYTANTTVNITATPSANWEFVNWIGDVADSYSNSTNVTVDTDKTIIANFIRVNSVLRTAISGSGSTTPAKGNHIYPVGATVNITAIPATNWTFVNWTGDISDITSVSTNVTMNTDKTVTAHFNQWIKNTLLTETIDSVGIVGNNNSLALDSSGYPYISYTDGVDGNLKLAYWDGSSWHYETTDNSSNYVGRYNSIAIDSSNNPKISYYDETTDNLKYASYNGTSWSIEVVDSSGDVGRFTSLALDSFDNPCISYYDWTNGNLKYAHWDSSAWQIEVVDSTDNVGAENSLELDSSSYPHISYRDLTNQHLKYAFWDGAMWQIQSVDNGGSYTSIILDAAEKPHISYYDNINNKLKYACWDGSTWQIEAIINDEGKYTSLALDSYGYPHISYEYNPSMDLNYARWDGSTWQISTFDSTDNVGICTSLALDSLDNPHISYSDYTHNTLKYAYVACTLNMAFNGSGNVTPVVGNHTYPVGSTVNITATPTAGWQFSSWTGDVVSPDSANTTVTMDDDKTITANFSIIPEPPAGGGGGDGGGGGVTEDSRTTSLRTVIGQGGILFDDVVVPSLDSLCRLYLPADTLALNRNGVFLTYITITTITEPPEPQEYREIIGYAYELEPEDSTFDPPITLTIEYDASLIPEGVSEENLFIAYRDESNMEWVKQDGTVNTEENTVTIKISRFSIYAIMASTYPAKFLITDLSVTPKEVEPGEEVTVTAKVTNNGDIADNFEVVLKINDVIKESKEVSLASGEVKTVDFYIISGDAGLYSVKINNLEITFKVVSSPSAFEVSSLIISPDEVDAGEQVDISVTVKNNGQAASTYEVILNIGGTILETKEISLTGGTSQQVTFTIIPDTAGKKIIDINGLLGSLIVRGEVPPPSQMPLPAEKMEPSTKSTIIPAEPEQTTSEIQELDSKTNWMFIGVIAGMCFVIASSLCYLAWWRKHKALKQSSTNSHSV